MTLGRSAGAGSNPRSPSTLAGLLGWRLRRLGAMSPGEVLARAVRGARHRRDDLEWRVARGRWERRWEPPGLGGLQARRPLGFLTAERGAALARLDPEGAASLVARADRTLTGEVDVLGYGTAHLSPEGWDYGLDQRTGFRWPDAHGKRIDYRHAAADPKWVWEVNRCQELPVLAATWLVTADGRYADAAASRLLHWISRQSPGRGIAWANGFEAAIRAISLAVTFDALASDAELHERLRQPVVRSLWQHARWIVRDPSTHSSANNHRIGELVGLLAVACLAPELPEARRWSESALAGLRREAPRQILADGTGAEQSFSYTLFVADLLLLSVALLDAGGSRPPNEVLDALDRVARALWAQVGRAGEPEPTYGDDDQGRAIRLDGLETRTARGVASAICARLVHEPAKGVAEGLDVTGWWLFGPEGRERFERARPSGPPASVLLRDAGRVVLRGGATRVGFTAGPLGYLSLAAHGHAAALSVTVSCGDAELVSDPGTGTYFGDPVVRDAFRGTGFHATVLVDEHDQSEPGGPFLWTRHARSWLSHVDLDAPLAAGEHDGYSKLDDPVRHRRAVVLLGGGEVLVVDRLDAARTHEVSLRWPLHEALTARLTDDGAVSASGGQVGLFMRTIASRAGATSLVRGQTDPFAGWSSRRLGELVPSPLVSWDGTFSGRLDIATVLIPVRGGNDPDVDVSYRREGDAADIAVTTGGSTHTARIDFEDPRMLAAFPVP